jgi:hypothetical protein
MSKYGKNKRYWNDWQKRNKEEAMKGKMWSKEENEEFR